MAARIIVNLPEGGVVLFGGAPEQGVADAGLHAGATRVEVGALEAAFGALGVVAAAMERAVAALPNRPEGMEVEFGATLSSDGDLWIVGPDASPEFTVRLAWEAD